MATQILGKVGVVPKGEYNSSTQYERLDIVTYNGQSYMAKAETVGNLPTNITYWLLLVQKPIKGTDYYTEQEIADMEADVANAVKADIDTDLALKQDITDNTLQTVNKTIPAAINEVNTLAGTANNKATTNTESIGTLSSLNTVEKNNLVGAINEVNSSAQIANSKADTNKNSIGTLANLNTTAKNTLVEAVNEVDSLAKGANQALSYGNYSTMITAFNALGSTVYNVGQNVMIVTLEVPDLWISSIESTSSTYIYTTDEAFITALVTNGYVQVGYYRLSALETQKVDLTSYYQKPNTGIPKTDLSNDVQTSLGKADSALQTHQDISGKQNITDNTLNTTSKTIPGAINEVNSLASGKYAKPSGGIPSTDMTTAVQTSLGKADAALPASKMVVISEADYEALVVKDSDTYYHIPEEE